MTTLDKIIERYRIDENDDGLGTIRWGGKRFYKKNSSVPILLNRTPGNFILTDDNKAHEIDNNFNTSAGDTLDNYYPHPFFEDKQLKGFKVISHLPNFKRGDVFLIQRGIQENDYIASGKFQSIYHVLDCLDFPEFFEPVYV